MKKLTLTLTMAVMAVTAVLCLNQGCAGKIPVVAAVIAKPLPPNYISDFNGGTLNMNPNLLGSSTGYFFPETYGGAPGHTNMINGNVKPVILVPNLFPSLAPVAGSSFAVHVSGPQSDPSPTTYPAFSVFAFLKSDASNPYYDLTPFTGIRFDVKIPANPNPAAPNASAWAVTIGDNNPQKRFAIATMEEVPPTTAPGGMCPPDFSANCYNYFWCTAPSVLPTAPVTNNGWQPVSFLFSTLRTDSGYGTALPGSTALSASNYRQHALFLLWKFGDNGGGMNSYTDFWFDNVQFY